MNVNIYNLEFISYFMTFNLSNFLFGDKFISSGYNDYISDENFIKRFPKTLDFIKSKEYSPSPKKYYRLGFFKETIQMLYLFNEVAKEYNIKSNQIPTITIGSEGSSWYIDFMANLNEFDYLFETNFLSFIQKSLPFQGDFYQEKTNIYSNHKIKKSLVDTIIHSKLSNLYEKKVNFKKIPVIGFEVSYFSGKTYQNTKDNLTSIKNNYSFNNFHKILFSNIQNDVGSLELDLIIGHAFESGKIYIDSRSSKICFFEPSFLSFNYEIKLRKEFNPIIENDPVKKIKIKEFQKNKLILNSYFRIKKNDNLKEEFSSYYSQLFNDYSSEINSINWLSDFNSEFDIIYSKINS